MIRGLIRRSRLTDENACCAAHTFSNLRDCRREAVNSPKISNEITLHCEEVRRGSQQLHDADSRFQFWQ